MNEQIIKIQNEKEEKVESLSIEKEDLKKRLEVGTAQITSIKKEFSETIQVAKQANMSNYNDQYSRKNNIKVSTFLGESSKTFVRIFLIWSNEI